MSAADDQLKASRATRDEARSAFGDRLEAVRDALAGRSVKDRVMHDAMGRVKDVAGQSLDVARQSRWIVFATLVALLGWLLRRPALDTGRKAAGRLSDFAGRGEPRLTWQRLRDWMNRKAKR